MIPSIVHSRKATGGRDDWQTAERELKLIRAVASDGVIGLDPCTAPENPSGARFYHTVETNGLAQPWEGRGLVYMNPPYSEAKKWVLKAEEEHTNGAEIIALLASRTGAIWFQPCFRTAQAICFIERRLKFKGAERDAPFESAFVYWGKNPGKFFDVFSARGKTFLMNQ